MQGRSLAHNILKLVTICRWQHFWRLPLRSPAGLPADNGGEGGGKRPNSSALLSIPKDTPKIFYFTQKKSHYRSKQEDVQISKRIFVELQRVYRRCSSLTTHYLNVNIMATASFRICMTEQHLKPPMPEFGMKIYGCLLHVCTSIYDLQSKQKNKKRSLMILVLSP